jgi:hypothetical protein
MGELLGVSHQIKLQGLGSRLGLALANFWRRQPRAALDGSLKPTRRELLDRYQSKVAPFKEVLAGPNPNAPLILV